MFKSRVLKTHFIFTQPWSYLLIFLLILLPYYKVDYQSCYLVAKSTNPSISLLDFIRHVLIEKSGIAAVMIMVLYSAFYWVHQNFPHNKRQEFKNEILMYFKKATFSLLVGFLVFIAVATFLHLLFPDHHQNSTLGSAWSILQFQILHFSSISLIMIGITIMGSIRNKVAVTIEVFGGTGKINLPVEDIEWIVIKNGLYIVRSSSGQFRTNTTLNKLEKMLVSCGFVRINRAAIVRADVIKSYNYWEHDKYLLVAGKSKEKEFVVSRQRMKRIRDILNKTMANGIMGF